MTRHDLRGYQRWAAEELQHRWSDGARVATLIAPTRSGKTLMCLTAVANRRYGARVLVVTPRKEIAGQWAKSAREAGYTASQFGGGKHDATGEVVCTTMASCVRHVETILATGGFGYLIFDEAHRAQSDSGQAIYDTFLQRCRSGKVLLTTATPGRSDERRLEFLMDSQPVVVSFFDAMLSGALLHGRVVEVSGALGLDDRRCVGRLFDAWMGHARSPSAPTIFFVDRLSHIEVVLAEANRRNVNAAGLSGKTPAGERQRIIDNYRNGVITMLVNVQVLTEGIDLNLTECVILASQPATRTPYIQRAGRALGALGDKPNPLIIVNRPRAELGLSQKPDIEEEWPEVNARRGLRRPHEFLDKVAADRAAGKNETIVWW